MSIDPVILLAEEICTLEKQIRAARKRDGAYDGERMKTANLMLSRLRTLYEALLETRPTSAVGAGELVRIAADRLSFSRGSYANHLYRIAARLGAGERQQSDLIWLRAVANGLGEEADGARASKDTATLLGLAVKGMATPVLVWRAAVPRHIPTRDLRSLLSGPGANAPAPFVPQSF